MCTHRAAHLAGERIRLGDALYRQEASCGRASAAATSSGDGPEGKRANATELAFWKSVQASDDPAEYGAYLARFPDGTFSALAHARIAGATPPGEVSAEDRSVELAFWDSIKGSDSKAMFEAYLEKFPTGEFRPLAEIRIAELAPSGTN